MLLTENPLEAAMLRLDRRRSSLGLSSLFEHVVPSSLPSMLEHRSSFSKILEEVGSPDGGGGSPTAEVPTGEFEHLSSTPWEGREQLDVFFAMDAKPGKQAPPQDHTKQAFDVLASEFLKLEDDDASKAVEMTPPPAVLKPGALIFDPSSPPPSPPPPPASPSSPRPAVLGVSHAKAPGAVKASGARRPRRPLPNSPAVQAAMPRPPRRGRKDPEIERAVAGMSPERARLEKNRQSAKECRLRKKEYVTNLEAKVVEFERREAGRAAELASVQAQLQQLQQQYQSMTKGKRS